MDDLVYLEAVNELSRLVTEAARRGEKESRSCALATAGADGRPSVRTVSFARLGPSGIAIFADQRTGKALQLKANPRAALCFHWPSIEQQAIVEGSVTWLSDEESDALWLKQPREYGLSHWASDQTAAESIQQVRERVGEARRQFDFERVPRPPTWRAFEVRPDRIDLWPTGWNRLHARMHYAAGGGGNWTRSRQNP